MAGSEHGNPAFTRVCQGEVSGPGHTGHGGIALITFAGPEAVTGSVGQELKVKHGMRG